MTITDLTPDPEGIDPAKAQRLLLWSVTACAAALCVAWLARSWARRAERAGLLAETFAGHAKDSLDLTLDAQRQTAEPLVAQAANPKPSPSGESTNAEEPSRLAADGGSPRD